MGGSVFMTYVAGHNFRIVDQRLAKPGASQAALAPLGAQTARRVLRHYASELNRAYFAAWEWVQIALGALLLIALLAGGRESPLVLAAAAAMLLIVLLFRFGLTPQITALGRLLDFPSDAIDPAQRSRFWDFHTAYRALEGVKWLLALGVMAKFAIGRRRSADAGDIHAIQKANHRHIDR